MYCVSVLSVLVTFIRSETPAMEMTFEIRVDSPFERFALVMCAENFGPKFKWNA